MFATTRYIGIDGGNGNGIYGIVRMRAGLSIVI